MTRPGGSAGVSIEKDLPVEGSAVTIQWMTRRRHLVITLAIALLALSSVSVDCGRTVRIVDMNGAPLERVFVIYHHEGYRLNPAHSTTYEAGRRSSPRVLPPDG